MKKVEERQDLKKTRGMSGLLGLAFLAVGFTGAHLYVNSQGPGYAGPLLVLDHVFTLVLVFALFAICSSVGTFVLPRCGYVFSQPLELLLFSTGIGGGILSTLILICGLLSGLQAPILVVLLVSCALLTRKELRKLPALVNESFSSIRAKGGVVSLTIFGTVALLMISQALAPPLDWDSLMYHLRVPSQFLQQGRIYLPEDNLHTAFVQLAHMLYIPLLAFGNPAATALLSTFFALALALALFAFCLRFLNGDTARLSLSVLWGSPSLLLVATTPRVDVTLAFYLFLAHYALMMALTSSESRRSLFLSAALLGMAFGIKYSALVYILALGPLIFWVARSRFQGPAAQARALLFFGLLAIVAALPWMIKNWILFQAPLYPYLAERQVEPWLAAQYPGRRMPAQIGQVIEEWHRQVSMPFSLWDLFVAPGRLMVENEASFYWLNPAFLALPLWVFLFLRNRTLNWLLIPALCYGVVLVLYLPSNNLRYLIPAVAPLTVAAAHIIEEIRRRAFGAKGRSWVWLLVVALALLPAGKTIHLWLTETNSLAYLTGALSRDSYLRMNTFPTGSRAYADIALYANRHVPAESRTLMLLEARGHYFDVPVIQDNTLTNWPLLADLKVVGDCLRSSNISHVLVNVSALAYYTGRGLDSRLLRWESFQGFAERCLVPVYEGRGFILYRVSA